MERCQKEELCRAALRARENAYCPYSHFAVGAALLCRDGRVYTGCNVESAAYAPSVCAERTAFCKAVSEGARDFVAIAIAGGPQGEAPREACPPCGVCRQVLREFAPELEVLLVNRKGEIRSLTLPELLPYSFGSANLT